MGLFFTLFYVFSAYIGPPILFGNLVQYHIELVVALLTLVCSVPAMLESDLLSAPQIYGIVGLTAAVTYSIAFNGWLSGAPTALFDFLPNAMVFFFVALNCKKKSHLQMLIAVLVAAALFTIYRGFASERAGVEEGLYVITMKNSVGENFYRIRGATFLNDPNDLAQFILALIPCVFFFWKKGQSARNLMFVYVPVCLFLFGIFLTHSRGAMIALMAAAVIAGRRKFGTTRSVVVGLVLFVGLSFAGFSGGRDVSAESGGDRMDAWAAGLEMIRAHPFKGVGYGRFTDFHEITAHNTVVLCAAELGLPGFFFWVLFTLPSVRDVYVGSEGGRPKKSKVYKTGKQAGLRVPDSAPAAGTLSRVAFPSVALATGGAGRISFQRAPIQGAGQFHRTAPELVESRISAPYNSATESEVDSNPLTDDEIRRLCSLMVVSFAGFLTAGWFLARAYTMTLFLIAGIGYAVYSMARDRKIAIPQLPLGRASWISACASVAFVLLVWIILRAHHF